jgi:hypothetical protein
MARLRPRATDVKNAQKKEVEVIRSRSLRVIVTVACLACAITASAQFGHPLKGSWSGDWGTSKDSRTRVLVDINWDGKTLTGTINPGPAGATLQKATLDPETWAVHLEADGKDQSGNTVHYVIDGKLENLGAYQRFITGTWIQGSTKGDFKLTRN